MGVFLCPKRKGVENMSPEIRINGKIIADVPDDTGWHQARNGTPLYVDTDLINADEEKQIIKLIGSSVGGARIVGLTLDGRGDSRKTKKGGDAQSPDLEVTLWDRPIRVTYSPRVKGTEALVVANSFPYIGYHQEARRTLHNPRWVRGHGRR